MPAEPARTRTRLSADERRRQLIGIGLRLLVDRPIHELSIDEVAAEAGISRGLLFRYFPTKRDYYYAVVEAAGRRLLKHAKAPETGTSRERVRGIVTGFVSFVQRRRTNYVALVRVAAGGDPLVLKVFEGHRRTIAERVLAAAEQERPTALTSLAVRGWLAMAEEMAVESTEEVVPAEELIDFLVANLDRVLDLSRATSA
ncbi:TetR/AcrR family transcriptional regulator [Streptomyces sp. XM4193]|uniref:TetR/AcrR family transcriptional regulator n=1 Tax=Streptomyces sp. XM4193 TaxID=2929782 RepID=UPI001FF7D7AE|nr:TetR/AcrR family transcriptional regulator [Streptomyces sp. XM4193]MCK1798942.1 TetR/AcrR family transcriptional regulator [Streptomyces sp. XM4193]